jgi:hypothetical protein
MAWWNTIGGAIRIVGRVLRDRRGNVALVFALLSPAVVGFAGLATEAGYWYHRRLELQSAADAAAYAAAIDLRAGAKQTHFTQEALTAAANGGFDPGAGTVTVNWPPQSGTHQTNQAIEVLISENLPRYFSGIFSQTSVVAHVRAVTTFQTASNACVLALNPSAAGSALFSGSSQLTLTGCSVMANSMSATAVTLQGAAKLSTDCVISVGGVQLGAGATLSVCPSAITQAPPVADPYADLPVPAAGACLNGNGAVLQPGTYCGGLDLKGTVTLNPGVYVIQGGDLKVNANANITGAGVTIYMAGSARVSMNGNATVTLDAPTTGTYAGVLFYGDRSSVGGSNTFNGTANSRMTGALYFAKQNVQYLGNFGGANGCTQVVGDTVTWSGNTHMSANCTAFGLRTLQAYEAVRFVE